MSDEDLVKSIRNQVVPQVKTKFNYVNIGGGVCIGSTDKQCSTLKLCLMDLGKPRYESKARISTPLWLNEEKLEKLDKIFEGSETMTKLKKIQKALDTINNSSSCKISSSKTINLMG